MNKAFLICFLVVISVFIVGCAKQGPAEQAGESIDRAIEDGKDTTEDAFEDAAESIEEGSDVLDEKAQDMGGGY